MIPRFFSFLSFLNAIALGMPEALSQDIPHLGMVYNTVEMGTLSYECGKASTDALECEFIQTSVRKKAQPNELEETLRKARDAYKNGERASDSDCKNYADILDVVEGRRKPHGTIRPPEMSPMQRSDLANALQAMVNFCKAPSEASYLNIARIGFDREVRTCYVGSSKFKQKFVLVQDAVLGRGTWVTKGVPEGPCGIVQLSRFVGETANKESKLIFWNYHARKAITNREGEAAFGVQCSKLDEREYVYSWRSRDHAPKCDYIDFSAF